MSEMSVPRPTIAAWWQTASTPSSAASTSAASRTSPPHELGAVGEIVGHPGVGGGVDRVEQADVIAAGEQRLGDVGPDEAGTAGDED